MVSLRAKWEGKTITFYIHPYRHWELRGRKL
jgi:hypothetical protein